MLTLTQQFRSALHDMKNTPQREDYHPEKWVYDHEALVFSGVHRLPDLSDTQVRELELVALFHDWGKVDTTRPHPKKGYLVSYGHEKAALPYVDAFRALVDDDLRFDVVEWLVLNHMKPKFFDQMRDSKIQTLQDEADALGPDVFDLLVAFNSCDDMRKVFRETTEDERARMVEGFDLFCEAQAQKLEDHYDEPLGGPYTLFLFRGAPGSGKTTAAWTISSMMARPVPVLSADDYFVGDDGKYRFNGKKLKEAHQDCQARAEQNMMGGSHVLVANTFTRRWEMLHYFRLAAEYRYMVHVMVIENRHGGTNDHNVPENKVQQMRDRMEFQL